MAVLKLGVVDRGSRPEDSSLFFRRIHEAANMKDAFRQEELNSWTDFRELPFTTGDGEAEVAEIQALLRQFGFYPLGEINGIFDYRTQSAMRLYQEYARSVDGDETMGIPDAIVGSKSRSCMERWIRLVKSADWVEVSHARPTAACARWLELLRRVKQHYERNTDPVVALIRSFDKPSDTRSLAELDSSPAHIHLLGIRRGADASWKIRLNNDLFVLLVNGLAFTFFGSTDPTPRGSRSERPPFLVPGQHRYRFGWHKLSDPPKVYRAFRPASHGVLVIRDAPGTTTDVLDEGDIAAGIDPHPNQTINIHWSGRHTKSWSAGCQVIAGGGYINHRDELVDCWDFAAAGYPTVSTETRGAYNVLLDLVTVFSREMTVQGAPALHYTLLNESDLDLAPELGRDAAQREIRRGLKILADHDPQKFREHQQALDAGTA